jgi:type II secretory ATPase GspE/PulE/Tfp pilus assembly ATPase PilB-like protein
MSAASAVQLHEQLQKIPVADPEYAVRFVDGMLAAARLARASDLHVQPTDDGLQLRWRLDGVLQRVGVYPKPAAAQVVARLKVLAELLTYRMDVPQEGRIRGAAEGSTATLDVRVSTFPTLYGEKAVVRLFTSEAQLLRLEDLGLPADIAARLSDLLNESAGAIVITGPAGSGKTTTAYACLRELTARHGDARNLVTIEDPIEVALTGVAQTQVNEQIGFDLAQGLRFMLRQDPEVMLIGEVRDAATARTALQAALTGHLVFTTFHAGSAASAVSRLLEMELEPYLLRSGVLAILNQRLVRRLCTCSVPGDSAASALGFQVDGYRVPRGCERCRQTGYQGRALVAEMIVPGDSRLGSAILAREASEQLEERARACGLIDRWERARRLIVEGVTSPAEVRRVFGWNRGPLAEEGAG